MMDKQEKLLRDILKEQKETNRLLKKMDRPESVPISQAELEQFKNFRTVEVPGSAEVIYEETLQSDEQGEDTGIMLKIDPKELLEKQRKDLREWHDNIK